MKTLSTTTIVALTTAALGLAAVAPAMAQEATQPASEAAEPAAPALGFRHDGGFAQRGDLGGLMSFERGGEAIELALVRLSHRIELTGEQQVLLDTLKSDALAAAETFTTATEDLRSIPQATSETAELPDITERFENRIALQQAQLAALEAIELSFTAFFGSLTDEQKASLMPERSERPDNGMRGHAGPNVPRGNGFGGPHRG